MKTPENTEQTAKIIPISFEKFIDVGLFANLQEVRVITRRALQDTRKAKCPENSCNCRPLVEIQRVVEVLYKDGTREKISPDCVEQDFLRGAFNKKLIHCTNPENKGSLPEEEPYEKTPPKVRHIGNLIEFETKQGK
jgi:hypothetical protein